MFQVSLTLGGKLFFSLLIAATIAKNCRVQFDGGSGYPVNDDFVSSSTTLTSGYYVQYFLGRQHLFINFQKGNLQGGVYWSSPISANISLGLVTDGNARQDPYGNLDFSATVYIFSSEQPNCLLVYFGITANQQAQNVKWSLQDKFCFTQEINWTQITADAKYASDNKYVFTGSAEYLALFAQGSAEPLQIVALAESFQPNAALTFMTYDTVENQLYLTMLGSPASQMAAYAFQPSRTEQAKQLNFTTISYLEGLSDKVFTAFGDVFWFEKDVTKDQQGVLYRWNHTSFQLTNATLPLPEADIWGAFALDMSTDSLSNSVLFVATGNPKTQDGDYAVYAMFLDSLTFQYSTSDGLTGSLPIIEGVASMPWSGADSWSIVFANRDNSQGQEEVQLMKYVFNCFSN